MRIFDHLLKFYRHEVRPPCPDCKGKGRVARDVDGTPEISICAQCKGEGKLAPTKKVTWWQNILCPNTLIVRMKFWMATWEMIKERPVSGHGLGSYKLLYPRMVAELDQKMEGKFLNPDYFPVIASEHSHCDWLEEIAELGIIGILLLISIFSFTFFGSREPLLMAGLISSLVAAIGFFPMREAASGLLIWVLAGLLC